jgi:Zn finger protein HypA/HybF involved in hydrogenase expression
VADDHLQQHVHCEAALTKFQPSEAQWKCPKCGGDNKHFVISCSAHDANPQCSKLHKEDEVECLRCGHEWSGVEIARILAKLAHVIVCPLCKGNGTVPDGEEHN